MGRGDELLWRMVWEHGPLIRPDLKPSPEKILGNSILHRGNTCSSCGQSKISLLKNSKKPVCLE